MEFKDWLDSSSAEKMADYFERRLDPAKDAAAVYFDSGDEQIGFSLTNAGGQMRGPESGSEVFDEHYQTLSRKQQNKFMDAVRVVLERLRNCEDPSALPYSAGWYHYLSSSLQYPTKEPIALYVSQTLIPIVEEGRFDDIPRDRPPEALSASSLLSVPLIDDSSVSTEWWDARLGRIGAGQVLSAQARPYRKGIGVLDEIDAYIRNGLEAQYFAGAYSFFKRVYGEDAVVEKIRSMTNEEFKAAVRKFFTNPLF